MLLVFAKAVRTALLANPAVSGLVAGRVFAESVPATLNGVTTPTPYLLITLNALRAPNTEAAESIDALVNVQAVSEGETNTGLAAQIADAVYGALNDATLAMDAPYTCRRCEFESAYRMTESKDNRRMNMAGGLYRIEADRD